MTWTLSTTDQAGHAASIALKNPEWSDAWEYERRQARVDTDGGARYVQDLGVTDLFLNVTWVGLDDTEWRGLKRFMDSAGWGLRDVTITVDGVEEFPVPIGTGQDVCEVPLTTGHAYGTGDLVPATAFVLVGRMDDPNMTLEQQQAARVTTPLRFRIEDPNPLRTEPVA